MVHHQYIDPVNAIFFVNIEVAFIQYCNRNDKKKSHDNVSSKMYRNVTLCVINCAMLAEDVCIIYVYFIW